MRSLSNKSHYINNLEPNIEIYIYIYNKFGDDDCRRSVGGELYFGCICLNFFFAEQFGFKKKYFEF